MLSRSRAAALCLGLVLVLTGCMRLDLDLSLQPDDTVDGSMTVAVDRELVEASGEDAESLAEQLAAEMLGDADERLGEVRSEPYLDEDFAGSTMIFTSAALDAFTDADTDESLRIVREGDDFLVSGVLDLSGEDQVALDVSAFEVRIAVTFPGAVAEHNGTLEGRTVTWSPAVGERLELSARGSALAGGGAGGGPSGLLVAAAGIALLAIAAAVVVLVLRSRRRPAEQEGDATGLLFDRAPQAAAPETSQVAAPEAPQTETPETPGPGTPGA